MAVAYRGNVFDSIVRSSPPVLLFALAVTLPTLGSTAALAADEARSCVPGAQIACACGGGGNGVQVCSDDGQRFGVCDCAAAAPVPPPPPVLPPPVAPVAERPRHSKGMMRGGIALIVIGVIAGGVGGTFLGLAAAVEDDFIKDGMAAVPASLIPAGAIMLATGIGLTVVGARREPAASPDGRDVGWAPGPQLEVTVAF
jgi:hypothetical protein